MRAQTFGPVVLCAAIMIAVLFVCAPTPALAQVEFVPDIAGRKWLPKRQAQVRSYREPELSTRSGQRRQARPGLITAPATSGGFFPWFISRLTLPAASGRASVEVTAPEGDGIFAESPGQSGTFFCVRVCDGYYFPLPPDVAASDDRQRQLVCSGMCRGGEMRLFKRTERGGTEAEPELGEALTSAIGMPVPYTALPAAYRYRDALVPGCGCQAAAAEAAAEDKAAMPTQSLPLPVFLSRHEDPDTASNRATLSLPFNHGDRLLGAEELAKSTPRKVRIVGPSYLVAQ